MNYNLAGYLFFLVTITYIIVVVGNICYKNGNIFVIELVNGNRQLCLLVNRVLLTGYYLFNIGYAFLTIIYWDKIVDLNALIKMLALQISTIVLLLAVMHYANIYILIKIAHKLNYNFKNQ